MPGPPAGRAPSPLDDTVVPLSCDRKIRKKFRAAPAGPESLLPGRDVGSGEPVVGGDAAGHAQAEEDQPRQAAAAQGAAAAPPEARARFRRGRAAAPDAVDPGVELTVVDVAAA